MKHRPRKTSWLKLGVFLLLGAVVNVAVAWGSACTIGCSSRRHLDARLSPFDRSLEGWYGGKWQRVGAIRLVLGRGGFRSGTPYASTSTLSQMLPRWARAYAEADSWNCTTIIDARGWPALSLWGGSKRAVADTAAPQYSDVILLRAQSQPGTYNDIRWLPLCPIWPGFAINTIFYAVILWLLWIAPGRVKRVIRVRRGLCPACGYQIAPGVGDKCSECGASIPFPLRGRAREGVGRTMEDPAHNEAMRSTHPRAPSLKGGGVES